MPTCSLCQNKDTILYIHTQDFFLTKEVFDIYKCQYCHSLSTHPLPKNLDLYYQSTDYLSHNKEKKGIISSIYLFIKKLALKWKLRLLQKTHSAKNILDIGSGAGDFINYCHSKGYYCEAVEPSDSVNAYYQDKPYIRHKEISTVTTKFDLITLWHVLEHTTDPKAYITRIETLLETQGCVMLAVPNPDSWDAKYYKEYWAGLDVPRHLWHFTKENIQSVFKHTSLKKVATIGIPQDAFYVSLLSEQYKGNPMWISLLKAVIIGTISNILAIFTGEFSSQIFILRKS